ncbi:hypothetical protein [Propylenella binzhouense]|uniref:Transmembrane protein n=1 Tax=Propylenella binzhouense TaxID=2555902 RepID=A0A964T203_9HYPH|nr:hypothetical protein [Propylenella binzhouense]MYZ46794.1 hypothetical protein [Propylenella binzhouense]
MIRRLLIYLLAALCLLLGLAFMVTPIPLGLPLLATGLILVTATSRRAAGLVLASRRGVPLVDRSIGFLEAHSGPRLRRALRRTRPGRLPRRIPPIAGAGPA